MFLRRIGLGMVQLVANLRCRQALEADLQRRVTFRHVAGSSRFKHHKMSALVASALVLGLGMHLRRDTCRSWWHPNLGADFMQKKNFDLLD